MHLWPSLRIRNSFKRSYVDPLDRNLRLRLRRAEQSEQRRRPLLSAAASSSSSSSYDGVAAPVKPLGFLAFAYDLLVLLSCCCCCFCCGACDDEEDNSTLK
ncbi:uncharacterized protein LOC109715312 [Ananas comosus]|uniref:Uncharacterized protein LOC109715312 n=1 Tax=Ananas comosus TaxID=4615 RepID=A0A199W2K3_ANACO|nr:uncharacterized protein LOC109715312 [Ananas comosus]OAY83428.1 hypothetical protein ACMD2_18866 [Ananas comosus]